MRDSLADRHWRIDLAPNRVVPGVEVVFAHNDLLGKISKSRIVTADGAQLHPFKILFPFPACFDAACLTDGHHHIESKESEA